MTHPTLKYLSSFNYHRVCVLKIRFQHLNAGQPSWQAHLSLQNVITPLLPGWPWQAPLSVFISPSLCFSIAHCCICFPHVANDCPGKGIFYFNLAFSQGGTKGTSSVQLVSLRKWPRIASFLGRLAIAYNPVLSAIVCLNLAIILCLFPFRAPLTN